VCAPGDDNRYVRVGWFARSKLSAYWCRDSRASGGQCGDNRVAAPTESRTYIGALDCG